ncbi:hypothetical protein SSCG_02907 [Streptomyces clavuligerus]|nr:hypothetical protein SSCG_02907 [Streptomyces clavuligerus]
MGPVPMHLRSSSLGDFVQEPGPSRLPPAPEPAHWHRHVTHRVAPPDPAAARRPPRSACRAPPISPGDRGCDPVSPVGGTGRVTRPRIGIK